MDYPRQSRSKKPIFVGALIVVLLALAGIGVYRYNRPVPALAISISKPASTATTATSDLPWPNSGKSALATSTGQVLGGGSNADQVSSTASIAKLITILTVLNKKPLSAGQTGPTITIGQADVDLYDTYYTEDGSNVEVDLGEKITEYQMLEAMLLPSGNNIADSLAIWAYGSMSAYKTAAQAEVKSLGMNHTTIGSDASGFAPDTTSTANDLVKLGEAASKQSVIMEIAGKKTATLPIVGMVATTNNLLGQDGITGLKTGTSDQAGNCFLFTATHTFGDSQNVTFVGVVLGAVTEDSRFTVTSGLLESTYADYKQVTVAKAGDSYGTIASAWGQSATVTPAADLTAYTWLGGTDGVSTSSTLAKTATNVKVNQAVGSISLDSTSLPLVASKTISQPSFLWRIFH